MCDNHSSARCDLIVNMVTQQTSTPSVTGPRAALALLGIALLAYALSDDAMYGGPPGFGTVQWLIALAGAALALASALPGRIVKPLLLWSIVGLVTLAMAEVAGNMILGPMFRPIYQQDKELIFKFVPDRTSTTIMPPINGGATVTHHINSEGYRGPELRQDHVARRVVAYGDSFIHAFYTADEDTFAMQLQSQLTAKLGKPIEVINAGVSSYGPDQISVRMQSELPRLKPDLVIVSVFAGNDFGDLLRNKMYRVTGDGTLVRNDWKLDPAIAEMFRVSQRESILVRTVRSTIGARLRQPADGAASNPQADARGKPNWQFLLDEADREYSSAVMRKDPIVTNTHVDYYSADLSLRPSSESARYKVRLMNAVLDRIESIAAASKTPILLLFIPHPADLSDSYDWGKPDPKLYPEYAERNLIEPLEQFATKRGVPFVSPFDAFKASEPNSLYLHGGDDHWNAAGQKLAAQLVADQIVKTGLGSLADTAPTGH